LEVFIYRDVARKQAKLVSINNLHNIVSHVLAITMFNPKVCRNLKCDCEDQNHLRRMFFPCVLTRTFIDYILKQVSQRVIRSKAVAAEIAYYQCRQWPLLILHAAFADMKQDIHPGD